MKNVLVVVALLLTVQLASADQLQSCVDIPKPEFGNDSMEPLPADQVRIGLPFYTFNKKTYHLSLRKESAQGLCRVYGRDMVRFSGPKNPYTRAATIDLSESGDVINTNDVTEFLAEVICK